MLGSSGILALWILAAGPAGTATASDCPNDVVTRTSFQQAMPQEDATGNSQKASETLKRLPPDPAYDGKQSLVAQNKEEGIPGLPPAPDETPATPKSETKPADDLGGKALPPKSETKDADGLGEAMCGDGPGSGPCEVVHGRPHRRGGLSNWLDGIDWDSWLDQGATLNTLSPRNRTNGPVTFNNRSNEYQFNQAYFRLQRDVRTDCDSWDVGGRVDFLYGTDSIYTEARGLELTDDRAPKWNAQQYGLAMPQLYAEVFAPWGNGISMKLGHFYAPIGYETVAAPDNFFYSHSYVFQYGEPFTYTGFMGQSTLGDFTIKAGMTRGWENWDDNNNDLGFAGGIAWTSCNKRTNISFDVVAGREQPDPSTKIRTLYSLVIQQKLGERWQYVIQHDYASEPDAGVDGTVASWYGVNQYLYRTINERWKAGMRFEWFRDENGSRVPGAHRTGDYYELTAGLNWTPIDRVAVRPELRWDWTGTPDLYPFGDGTRSNQLLLDCDVIVRF